MELPAVRLGNGAVEAARIDCSTMPRSQRSRLGSKAGVRRKPAKLQHEYEYLTNPLARLARLRHANPKLTGPARKAGSWRTHNRQPHLRASLRTQASKAASANAGIGHRPGQAQGPHRTASHVARCMCPVLWTCPLTFHRETPGPIRHCCPGGYAAVSPPEKRP